MEQVRHRWAKRLGSLAIAVVVFVCGVLAGIFLWPPASARPMQPLVDALAQPLPHPPAGRIVQEFESSWSMEGPSNGPGERDTYAILHERSVVIDLTDVPAHEIEGVIDYYADHLVERLADVGVILGFGSSGNVQGLRKDGTFYIPSNPPDKWESTRLRWSAGNTLRVEGKVYDWDGTTMAAADREATRVPDGTQRFLWLRLRVYAHGFTKIAQTPPNKGLFRPVP